MRKSSIISLSLSAAFGVATGLTPVSVAVARSADPITAPRTERHKGSPAWVATGISNLNEFKCLVEKAARNGIAFEVANMTRGDGARTTLVMIKWNMREFCTVPPNERQAAIELVNKRAVEAAEQKAAKAKRVAEQAAAELQFSNSRLEAARAVEKKAAVDKADAEERIAEVRAVEAKANNERTEADLRIAEATVATGKAAAAIAAAQAAKEKVPAIEKAAAERTALAEKAAAEQVEADRRIAAANAAVEQANTTIAKLEANRRIAAANAAIDQANTTIAAAQATKDKAVAAEKTAKDKAAAAEKAAKDKPAAVEKAAADKVVGAEKAEAAPNAAAEKALLPVVKPTSAPQFHKPSECDRDEKAMEPRLKSLMRSQDEACARGQCPDDMQGQVYAFYDQHTSQACRAAKSAHLAAWTKWYDSASPEEREQQRKNTGGNCGWDWPIACKYGF